MTDRLLLILTERYYNEVSRYFDYLEELSSVAPLHIQSKKMIELQISKKLKDYRLTILRIQRRLLTEQLTIVDRIFEMYSRD